MSGGEKEVQILSGIKDGGDVPDRSYPVTEVVVLITTRVGDDMADIGGGVGRK